MSAARPPRPAPIRAPRIGGLRARTYGVVLVVVLAPLALVVVADRSGARETTRMQDHVDRAAAAVAGEVGRGASVTVAAERAAAEQGVRVFVIDAREQVLASSDHEPATSLRDRVGDALFGPDGAPTLRAFDATRPAVWPEVLSARRDGRSSGCSIGLSGTLVVCHSAVAARIGEGAPGAAERGARESGTGESRAGESGVGESGAGGRGARESGAGERGARGRGEQVVVLAQESSPRAIRALFDLRYPMLKLTLYVLLVGALLAAWLGRRLVGPVLRLRREVLSRAGAARTSGRGSAAGDRWSVYEPVAGKRGSARGKQFVCDPATERGGPVGRSRPAGDPVSGREDVAGRSRPAGDPMSVRGDVARSARAGGGGPAGSGPIPRVSNDEVGDLADAFNALLAALEARERANEAFAEDLAHELKSPIAALRACSEGIAGPLDAARAERLARVLADSTARLDGVVTRFLALARAEAGLPGEERSALDVAALVHGLCASLSEEGRYPGVRFDATGDRAEVEGAAGPLEEALRNIVENAASFAGEGGWVRARVAKGDEGVTVEVADSGPGIAPDSLPRVFDRFFTERRDRGGTGLGLAYAKAVIEAHGGSIRAESPEGSGAVLTVTLPPR